MERLKLKQDKKHKESAPLSNIINKYSLLIGMILLSSCSGKELPKIKNIHELCINNNIGSFCNKFTSSGEGIIPTTSIKFKESKLEIEDIGITNLLIPLEGVCEDEYKDSENKQESEEKYTKCINNTTISYDGELVEDDFLEDIPKEKQNFLLVQLRMLMERLDLLRFLTKNK